MGLLVALCCVAPHCLVGPISGPRAWEKKAPNHRLLLVINRVTAHTGHTRSSPRRDEVQQRRQQIVPVHSALVGSRTVHVDANCKGPTGPKEAGSTSKAHQHLSPKGRQQRTTLFPALLAAAYQQMAMPASENRSTAVWGKEARQEAAGNFQKRTHSTQGANLSFPQTKKMGAAVCIPKDTHTCLYIGTLFHTHTHTTQVLFVGRDQRTLPQWSTAHGQEETPRKRRPHKGKENTTASLHHHIMAKIKNKRRMPVSKGQQTRVLH